MNSAHPETAENGLSLGQEAIDRIAENRARQSLAAPARLWLRAPRDRYDRY
jgi:hypothetical protein